MCGIAGSITTGPRSVRQRHEAGKPMHYTAIRVENNPLLCAARYHFGSWPNALAAAGIEPEQPPGSSAKRD